jgi:osmotically-inducible protein OsmY
MGALALFMVTASPLAANMDKSIEDTAKKTYVFIVYLKDDDIKIHSQDGVVTLSGTVSDESHLALAEDTVADLPGVKKVDNQLVIKGEVPTSQSDAWIYLRIRTMLMLHRNLDSANTEFTVKDGVVTLKGELGSQAEKGLTTEYVRDVQGVKEVNNEMTVIEGPEKKSRSFSTYVDDASIKAQIKMALLLHRGTHAFTTQITVRKGVVTVTGTAQNAAEKELVTKRIEDVHGVVSIDNRMIIE